MVPGFLAQTALALSRSRTAAFSLEFLLFRGLSAVFFPNIKRPKVDAQLQASVRNELDLLLKKDSENIQNGVYPIQVLQFESPLKHLGRVPRLLVDGFQSQARRRRGRTAEFQQEAESLLDEVPRYYRRNFHFQTDGYLSRKSAELYDHQVEILFRGSANAMRRIGILPLKSALSSSDGEGLKFLELGAGTGTATRMMRLAFPKARIVATDLSAPYLEAGRQRLAGDSRVDWMRADAGRLPFRAGEFDLVYSVFLFHELPESVRAKVLTESRRVLRDGGIALAVDSIQLGDLPDLNPVLVNFPKEYHEPYYRNYLEVPLPQIFDAAGLKEIRTDRGFLSKVVWARKIKQP